jgi:CheY-like chemotaxis protein
VDDNVDSAESMAEMLRMWGHEVQLAHNGPEALGRAAQCDPEMVLLDIGLPGMDGYRVAERLRRERDSRGLVLIALTGLGQKEDRDRAFAAGFDHHLTKPVNPNALRELLERGAG